MKWLLLSGVLGAALLAGTLALAFDGEQSAANGSDAGPYRGSEPAARFELPGFRLRNYDGREIDSTSLRGRVVVLTFLDSQCTDVCPILASQIGGTIDRFSPAEREQVTAVAISTDPDEDTPASVRAFLGKQRALGRILYLRGTNDEMRPLWSRFQILASLESGEDTLHSAPVRIYDRESVWVATLHTGVDLTEANLLHDIRAALDAGDENSR